MSALEKPTQNHIETNGPAEQAGIFLSRTYELGASADPPITEIVPKVQALERQGRLIAQYAMPGVIIIHALPDAEGRF